jgi:cohesin complex subunit SA-1/2
MKKDDPVRMLESQMASLRQSYENWVEEEPDMENDAPSDEEMKEFEEAEARHKQQFEHLENRAAQFSKKLGVFGKLSDERKLRPALNGFIREGIRFSFSNLDNNGEDTLVLGSRLSFLSILSKYASWIKRDKPTKKEIQRFIDEKEVEMKNHEEFEEVHEDDLEALAAFRGTLGLKSLPKASANVAVASGDEDEEMDDEASDGVNELQSPVASVSSRTSKASRASSRASSRVSSLPALPEGKESPQDSDEESHFSAGSSSNKRKSQTQNTYENSDESDSDDSSIGLGYSQKSRKARRSK